MGRYKLKIPKDATVKVANFVNTIRENKLFLAEAKFDVEIVNGNRVFTITIEQPVTKELQ
jgi:hypothetical protein